MESAPVQSHSNGSAHGRLAALSKPSSSSSSSSSTSISTSPFPAFHLDGYIPPPPPASNSPTETSSPITSPPYWVQSHHRSVSNISVESIASGAIRLQDNTDGRDDKNEACWAKEVQIKDHVVINGNRTGIGAFVVWNITVETLSGASIRIRKRYSEFDDLRDKLLLTFPLSEAAMPPLPPKGVISKFRPKFLEQRRIGLSYFLNCILLNPEFSGSPVLKEFLFE